MNLASALAELKAGNKVFRPDWNTDDQKIWLKEVTFNGFEPTLVQYNYFPSTDHTDKYPGAALDYDDMCAVDWEVRYQ